MSLDPSKLRRFPKLGQGSYRVTSSPTFKYNCIAYAAGITDAWYDPNEWDGSTWPDNIPRECTLDSYIALYASLGYSICSDAALEDGFEKVALYKDFDGDPSHAARQLESGKWTSKLGDWEDIEHATPNDLEGLNRFEAGYGVVVCFMRRRRTGSAT